MTVVPHFLLKRVYVKNSLRAVPEGAAFDLTNVIGPGSIVRVNGFGIDGQQFGPESITLRSGEQEMAASAIDEKSPAFFPMNQKLTCIMRGASVTPGKHKVTVDIVSLEGGHIVLSLDDTVSADKATSAG